MASLLQHLFTKKLDPPKPPEVSGGLCPVSVDSLPVEVVYPPRDLGLPVVDPQLMVRAAKPRLDRLYELVVSDRAQWQSAYLEPIERLATLVHLLPASPSDLYSAPSGLFNLSLDVAFFSLQSADGKIFTPDGSVEDRHKNEPRWRYATFLAALSCQAFRAMTRMTVVNDKGAEWPRFSIGLAQWLVQTNSSRYHVNWHEEVHNRGAEGAAILSQIAPRARLDWLAQGDVQIVRDMHQVALGTFHESQSIMAKVVRAIVDKVERVDDLTRRSRYGRLTVGTHVQPVILDVLRELVQDTWMLNRPGSPLWWGTDGLWLQWPEALKDYLRQSDARGFLGLPRTALTVAELLASGGAVLQSSGGDFIQPMMVLNRAGETTLSSGMRWVQPETLLGMLSAEPLARPIGAEMYEAARNAGTVLQTAPPSPTSSQPTDAAQHATSAAVQPGPPSSAPAAAPGAGRTQVAAVSVVPIVATPTHTPANDRLADLLNPQARALIRDESMAEVFGQLLQLFRSNRGDVVKAIPYGIAICNEWLAENSASGVGPIFKLCTKNQWLGAPKGKPNLANQLLDVQFDDRLKLALVLSQSAARLLGFEAAKGSA